MAIRHDITLSTTEPNNDVGLLKIRQADEETQTLVVDITANGQPKSYEGLQPFFCAKLGQSNGLGIIEQKLDTIEIISPKNGKLEYTFRNEDWQHIGRQTGYFSFRRMMDNNEYVEQFTTRDFYFTITKNVFSDGIRELHTDGAIHIWTIEDLIRLLNEYIASGKSDWEQFVEDNREIIQAVDPGGTVLTELIDARKPADENAYPTLGDRLNDMPFNSDFDLIYGDDTVDVDGGIPAYQKPVLADALSLIDTSLFNMSWGTDYHYDTASDYNPHSADYTKAEMAQMWNAGLRKTLNMTSLSTKLDAVVFGGDNVDQPNSSAGGRPVMVKHNQDFASTVFSSSVAPTFLLKGNHDCNYNSNRKPETVILDSELAPIYRQDVCLFGESRLNKSNYFYKDFDDKKIRLIGLDMYDLPETVGEDGVLEFNRFSTSGLQQAQLDWLANDALLTTPNGYTVLLTGHSAPDGTMYSGRANHNHDVLIKILESFVSGTATTIVGLDTKIPATVNCQFNVPSNIAGFLFGHWHKDESVTINGINYVETRCSSTVGEPAENNEWRLSQFGTPNEDAFDIVTIDTVNRKMILRRVGAGADTVAARIFNY